MSEIKARASRRAFNAGSWDRNGLVGRPPGGAEGVALGEVEPPVEGAASLAAAGDTGADAGAAGERFAFAGVAGGTAGPPWTGLVPDAGLETW